MQALKNITAAFCLACVSAEALALLTAKGWPRRCIKAAAGLYILLSLMYALPKAGQELKAFSVPQTQVADFGTAEQAVLRQAERQLEESAAAQCLEATDVSVTLDISLAQSGNEVSVKKAMVGFSAEAAPEQREKAIAFLRVALGAEPLPAGEGTP